MAYRFLRRWSSRAIDPCSRHRATITTQHAAAVERQECFERHMVPVAMVGQRTSSTAWAHVLCQAQVSAALISEIEDRFELCLW